MWSWRKTQTGNRPARGEAHAPLAGSPRQQLMREAIQRLARDSHADRIGIWLEQEPPIAVESASAVLKGVLWEAGAEDTPPEWERLSLEPPLPQELLAAGQSVDLECDPASGRPIIGPLVGLRHALWTPVRTGGHLRGVVLTGGQRKSAAQARELPQSVAAHLALALQLEDERRLASERQTDLCVSKEILAALASGTSTETILSRLAASCTARSSDAAAPLASFAVIGHQRSAAPVEMDFSWESGDAEWTVSVSREPLRNLWRDALAAGRVLGIEPPASWAKAGIARLLAIPLAANGTPLGVLIAGVSQQSSSLATLERLELRAFLAVAILQRRQSQGTRVRALARRSALLEASSTSTVLLDASGTIVALNSSAKSLLAESRTGRDPAPGEASPPEGSAHDPDWFIGGPLAQLFSAREQDRMAGWSRQALAGPRDEHLEPSLREAELVNGRRVRLQDPIASADDLVAVVLDPLSAHANATRSDRSEAELHNVLEWVEEGILLFGADHSIRAMNTRFAQIAGLSAEEAGACRSLDHLIVLLSVRAAEPEQFARRWRELARGTEGGGREEVPLARPVPRVLERSVRPILDAAGQRLGRVEIYRDLSAQRSFQARLLQTEKLAALGQMITGVAHELSSPLTSILGYSQRLLVRKDPAGHTEEARQIYQEAERASTILRQLLLTARDSHPERKKVSLNQLVLRATELQRFGAAAEKIRTELDLDPTLPFVRGDAGQLQQVLMNLISNARQAIAQEGRGGTIRLRTARTTERRVLLEVSDDGPGIPQAILGRIFDPFFTTKPPDIGTGLGLSIVLGVVREHGGTLHVSSPPGGGAKFTVELPAAAGESAAEHARRSPATSRERTAPLASRKPRPHLAPALPAPSVQSKSRVLVLEDEPTVARLIGDVLEDEGMQVDVLLDGREALERAGRESYDLVICDMKMPGLDGQQFYRSLSGEQNPLQNRFLFVTGDVLAAQTQEFLESNHLPHVAKPFRVEELTEKVFALLENETPRGAQAAAAKKAN